MTFSKNCQYFHWVYSYRKRGYAPITDSDNFEYHAFVVYCDADRLWVHNKFVNKLEKEQGVQPINEPHLITNAIIRIIGEI
jgi:hypothetical protein